MLKIAIIDDEELLAKKLAGIVSDYMSREDHLFHIDIFTSGIEFTNLGIKMSEYKIVCLDVKMDGMTGLEVARKIRDFDKDVYIIFITAYMDFSLEGYKVGAIRFILKDDPVFVDTMYEALREVYKKIVATLDIQLFHFKEGIKKLSTNKIVYVESKVHDVIFRVKEDSSNEYQEYRMRTTLSEVEDMFSPNKFIRIHKSYLVNYRYIESIKNYKVYLVNQKTLSIPKNKYGEIKEKYLICKAWD